MMDTSNGLDAVNMGYNKPVIRVGKKQYTIKEKDHFIDQVLQLVYY